MSRLLERDVAIGQLYAALSRLEEKGMISFKSSVPEARRGGRAKKVFHLEAPGVRALESIATALDRHGALPFKESSYGAASPS